MTGMDCGEEIHAGAVLMCPNGHLEHWPGGRTCASTLSQEHTLACAAKGVLKRSCHAAISCPCTAGCCSSCSGRAEGAVGRAEGAGGKAVAGEEAGRGVVRAVEAAT